ncbi:MAG: hypothetical protein B9S34_04395 [Opitutia bacterium Tous-C1TDCM]|nr:MAG: hypothetical protein B9S34_04395 [Opitutae bacterium Tous-C1TDCM]
MNPTEDESDRIADAAALWLAEADEGLAPDRRREFEAWQRQDPRHAAALRRLQWGQTLLRQLPAVRDTLPPPPAAAPSAPPPRVVPFPSARRRAFYSACAAAVLVGLFAWWQWPTPAESGRRYVCEAGGYQRVLLDDGSVVEMNQNSAVLVAFAPGVRRIVLQSGEVHFRVAKDPRRPFVVAAAGVTVRAVGTAFLVNVGSAGLDLLVTEGRVAVADAPGSPGSAGEHLADMSAGERTRIPLAGGVRASGTKAVIERVDAAAIRRALAWQEKRLFFDAVPLRDAVEEFNRRNRLRLVLTDPALAARPVAGVFASDNVEGFVRLMEQSGTVRAERRGEFEIALHPATDAPR